MSFHDVYERKKCERVSQQKDRASLQLKGRIPFVETTYRKDIVLIGLFLTADVSNSNRYTSLGLTERLGGHRQGGTTSQRGHHGVAVARWLLVKFCGRKKFHELTPQRFIRWGVQW